VRELRNLIERSLLRTDEKAPGLEMDLAWLKYRQNPAMAVAREAHPLSFAPAHRELSPIEQQEYELIARTLAGENGGIRRAATKLGLTHQALLRRLEKWPELRQITPSPG
jgi:DNA-binding NtrC family response regulator